MGLKDGEHSDRAACAESGNDVRVESLEHISSVRLGLHCSCGRVSVLQSRDGGKSYTSSAIDLSLSLSSRT